MAALKKEMVGGVPKRVSKAFAPRQRSRPSRKPGPGLRVKKLGYGKVRSKKCRTSRSVICSIAITAKLAYRYVVLRAMIAAVRD